MHGSFWDFVAAFLRAWHLPLHITVSYLIHKVSTRALLCSQPDRRGTILGQPQKPRLLSPSQHAQEGQMFGFCWIKLLAGD